MEDLFIEEGTWTGGYYELAIELGPTPDPRVDYAISALWHYPLLERADNFGIATLPDNKRAVFRIFNIPEENGQDWLVLGMPCGALARAYNIGGFPFGSAGDTSSREWREPVEQWLVDLGRYIYSHIPYQLGIIGMEVSGDVYAQDILTNGIPDERSIRACSH